MTCPESITRDRETRHCIRTGPHREHYTGFPSRYQRKRVVLDVYTWVAP